MMPFLTTSLREIKKFFKNVDQIQLRPSITPFNLDMTIQKGHGFYYKGQEFIHHSTLHDSQSSFHRLSTLQIILISILLVAIFFSFFTRWHMTLVLAVGLLTILYFADLLFNLYLIYRSFIHPIEIQVKPKELKKITHWPRYTIMCPLYKEWQVVPQFVAAMRKLEYPKNKLQIMLLLEEDDTETIEHVKTFKLPSYFDVVIVPDSKPKTKPKACNYGLTKTTGEYITIYDAEDIPDVLQLKKVVAGFQKVDSRVICIQAKLNFYNPHQNLLTRIFTAEYSLWFDLVLTGLQSINAPIPLGGTSNHFKLKDILHIKGWDSFNVTEDCDLGMRLIKNRYKTALIDSVTLEEANSSYSNWFWQRSRWIKGYMQTYLVHMRKPQDFMQQWSDLHLFTFQLVVGGKVLSMFINPVMWLTTILYFLFRMHIGSFIESLFPTPILYMGLFSLLIGNFLYAYYYMVGCAKHGHHELVKYVFLVPFYWLAMSAAAWVAFYKLLTAPHHWSKTKHGLHLANQKAVTQRNVKVAEARLQTI